MMIVSIGLVPQALQAGKLKVLGFGSTERLPQFPDVPTLAESGCRATRQGRGTASSRRRARRARSSTSSAPETQKIFSDPAFRDKFLAPAMTFSIASSPEKFAERIHADLAKWGKVIKDAKASRWSSGL